MPDFRPGTFNSSSLVMEKYLPKKVNIVPVNVAGAAAQKARRCSTA